jgi:hypothetical protein
MEHTSANHGVGGSIGDGQHRATIVMGTSIFQPAHTTELYNDLRRAITEQAKKERSLQYLAGASLGQGLVAEDCFIAQAE